MYVAKGHCKAIKNPFGKPIQVLASWGEMQYGATDCWLAVTYDPDTGEEDPDLYIIGSNEFDATYKPAEEK